MKLTSFLAAAIGDMVNRSPNATGRIGFLAPTTKKRAATARRKKAPATRKAGATAKGSSLSRGRATGKSRTATRPTSRSAAAAESRLAVEAQLAKAASLGHMGRLLREVGGIVCMFAALIGFLALISFHPDDPGWSHTGIGEPIRNSVGRAGAWFADVSLYLLGYMAYLLPTVLAIGGYLLFRDQRRTKPTYRPYAFVRLVGLSIMLVSAAGLADLHFSVAENALPRGTYGGGILGTAVAWRLVSFLQHLGTTLVLLALFFSSMTLTFGTSWLQLIETIGEIVLSTFQAIKRRIADFSNSHAELARMRAADEARDRRLQTQAQTATSSGSGKSRWPWRSANKAIPELDPLLDIDADNPPRVGLGAALAQAREKARATQQAAQKSAAMVSTSDSDDVATGKAAGSNAIASSTSKRGTDKFDAMGESLQQANEMLADDFDKTIQIDRVTAQALSNMDSALENAEKPREIDQRQTKLYLDVPDSDLPPLSLLDAPEPQRPGFSESDLEALSRLLEEKLAEFRITVQVVAVHPGPVITRFEMELAPGIKASRITGLSQDIARSMSLVSVRVVEVIAGKSTIGIEVPNDHREIVQLTEMLQSPQYNEKKSPLTLALGKDISGQSVTADLGRMPHLLVAGTTGSGKSVAVNSMLISLLYKATAKDVRLILIDPKMLELNVYDGIPHLLSPVVTDMKEAANALRWCVGEMERRYTMRQ